MAGLLWLPLVHGPASKRLRVSTEADSASPELRETFQLFENAELANPAHLRQFGLELAFLTSKVLRNERSACGVVAVVSSA